MKAMTELESRKASLLKAFRTAIRLRYSLAADEEIRRLLPELEQRIDLAIQSGEPFELDVASIFSEVESSEASPLAA